jgi:hypothetical protein
MGKSSLIIEVFACLRARRD